MNEKNTRDIAVKALLITAAMAIDGFSVACFMLPYDLIVGGVTGIGRVITAATGMPVSISVGVLEIAMLVLAFIFLGKDYGLSIVLASLEYPVFLEIFGRIKELDHMTGDLLVASVFSGLLTGAALGIVIRAGSASGGTDVLTLIFNKKFKFPLAPTMHVIEAIVLVSQFRLSGSDEILLGLLSTLIATVVVDKVVVAGTGEAQILIFSSETVKIKEALIQYGVGLTLLHGETGFIGEQRDVILTVVHKRRINNVQKLVQDIDPVAFITISQIRDVRGRGFTIEQLDLPLAGTN